MKNFAIVIPMALSVLGSFATAEVKEGVEYKFLECSETYGTTFRANLMVEDGSLYLVNKTSTAFEPTFKLEAQYLFLAREGYELGVGGAFTQVGPRGDTFTNDANYISMYELTNSQEPQSLSLMSVGFTYTVDGESKQSEVEYRNCTVNNKGMFFDYAPQR